MSGAGHAPLVSVIVCVYNGEPFLPAAIHSAFEQLLSDFEIVAVDDGSTDRSASLLASYGDPRLRVLRQRNQGSAAALEAGLEAARGEYVALLDQDDVWKPDFLAAHVDLLKSKPGVDLTFSWFQVIDGMGREIGVPSNRYRGAIDFEGLLADFVIGASSNVMMRRDAIARAGGVDPALPRLYDMDLCLRVALLAPRNVEAIPRDLMQYRRHKTQISRDVPALEREWEWMLEKLRVLAPREAGRAANRGCSNMNRYFARLAYGERNYGRGLGFLARACRQTPAHFVCDSRNWLTGAACLSGLIVPARLQRKLERIAGLKLDA